MNKNSNKSKLSKKLKFISVASAITICAVSSTGGTEASASIFRNGWNRFVSLFSRSSTPTTTSSGRLNRPNTNATLSGTSSSTTNGSGSVWNRLKSKFSSSGSNQQNKLKTTDLDAESDTSSRSLWSKFKGLFTRTSGNNTTSNQNKSGVTNQAYTPDNDETPVFNPKNDDQNLKNLDYLLRTSKPESSSTPGEDGVQYVSLDFSGKTSSNTVHGGGDGVIYATIKPPTEGTGSTSSSSSSGSSSGGRRPIPTPRKNLSSSLQTSSTGSNDGNNGGNITGVLTSKTQGTSSDSQSSSSSSTGPVIVGEGYGFRNIIRGDDLIMQVVPPPTPPRPAGLGSTTTGGSNVLTPRTTTGGGASSNTGGDGSTRPKLVTFKSE